MNVFHKNLPTNLPTKFVVGEQFAGKFIGSDLFSLTVLVDHGMSIDSFHYMVRLPAAKMQNVCFRDAQGGHPAGKIVAELMGVSPENLRQAVSEGELGISWRKPGKLTGGNCIPTAKFVRWWLNISA